MCPIKVLKGVELSTSTTLLPIDYVFEPPESTCCSFRRCFATRLLAFPFLRG